MTNNSLPDRFKIDFAKSRRSCYLLRIAAGITRTYASKKKYLQRKPTEIFKGISKKLAENMSWCSQQSGKIF
jgi:hypothetical protein